MNSSAKILGEDNSDIELATSSDHYAATLELVSQAAHTIDIFTQQLTESIYNHLDLIDQIKRCLLASHTNNLRILIKNPDHLLKSRSHLTALAQRLSSNLHIKKIHADYAGDSQDFLVVDGRGIIRRAHGERFEGIANFNNPAQGKELTDYFDEVWNHSQLVTDIKRLYI